VWDKSGAVLLPSAGEAQRSAAEGPAMQRLDHNDCGFCCRPPLVPLHLWPTHASAGGNSQSPGGRALAKQAAIIPVRGYPRALAGIRQGGCDHTPLRRGWPTVALPPKAVFDASSDVCSHARLLSRVSSTDVLSSSRGGSSGAQCTRTRGSRGRCRPEPSPMPSLPLAPSRMRCAPEMPRRMRKGGD